MDSKKKTPAALALFMVLTLLMTYPLVFHPGTGLRGLGDPLLNTWIMNRNIDKIAGADFRDYFNANIYYPHKRTLAYSEHLLPQSLAALPVKLLSGNPILAYNLVFLLAILTSGLGMYWLAFELTRNAASAIAAGIIFAFCPFMMAHLFQVQMLTAAGIPLSFLFLHKYFEKKRTKDFVLFGIFYILQVLANVYYAFFLTLFAGLFILIKAVSKKMILRASFWTRLAVFAACVLVVSGPFFYQYALVQKEMGFEREIGAYAEPKNFLATPPINRLYGSMTKPFRKQEGELFPGMAAFLLAVAGAAWGMMKDKKTKSQNGELSSRSERNWIRIYIIILILAFLFALGPAGPYVLLHKYVPGFNGLRAASRFHVFVMFSLAVLAAFGLRNLLARIRRPLQKSAAAFVVCFVLLVEYASFPIPIVNFPSSPKDIPEVYRWLSSLPDTKSAVLELPIPQLGTGIGRLESPRVYYSIFHGHPLVNGYSGFFPPLYVEIGRRWREIPIGQNIADLKELGVRYLILHEELFPAEESTRLREELARLEKDVRLVGRFGEARVYEVEAGSITAPGSTGRVAASSLKELPRLNWTVKASVNPERARLAVDGNVETRWDSGFQQGGETFEIDLGESRPVRLLSLGLGGKAWDYPKNCRVDVSEDGVRWAEASRLDDLLIPIRDFLMPREMTFDIVLPAAPTRHIRITNGGTNPSAYWSIYEINAFERP